MRAQLDPASRLALAQLVARVRYELIPSQPAPDQAAALPPRAWVTVTALRRLGMEATVEHAAALAARGHEAVPHLAARLIRDRTHLDSLLRRIRDAGLRRIFVIGGDGRPIGEYHDALALLRAIAERGETFNEVGVAAYPEGHPGIPDDRLMRALAEKQPYAHSMTTQMSFNPGAVAAWIRRVRDAGITLPIHLGVPGAVALPRLLRVAARIGVADSTRYLLKHRALLGRAARRGAFGPDAVLDALAPAIASPGAGVRALHVFTLNEIAASVAWQRRTLDELA